jgi:hypothetical protein
MSHKVPKNLVSDDLLLIEYVIIIVGEAKNIDACIKCLHCYFVGPGLQFTGHHTIAGVLIGDNRMKRFVRPVRYIKGIIHSGRN